MELCRFFLGMLGEEGGIREFRVRSDERVSFVARRFHHFDVAERFHADVRETPLLPAIQLAAPALGEIEFSELEAVFSGFERPQSLQRARALRFRKCEAVRLMI